MGDKPILFSAPMVLALLAGTKTQTRRVLNPPEEGFTMLEPRREHHGGLVNVWLRGEWNRTVRLRIQPGDRLYVREAWRINKVWDAVAPRDLGDIGPVHYEADQGLRYFTGKFRQGMHMPKRFSRITLHVNAVRVQRLHEIRELEALAEGVVFTPPNTFTVIDDAHERAYAGSTAVECYRDLWNGINGAGAWEANPWVSCTSFTVEKINIDQARAA